MSTLPKVTCCEATLPSPKVTWFTSHRNFIVHLLEFTACIGAGRVRHPGHALVLENHVLHLLESQDKMDKDEGVTEHQEKSCDCLNDVEHTNFINIIKLLLAYMESKKVDVENYSPHDMDTIAKKYAKLPETFIEYLDGAERLDDLLESASIDSFDLSDENIQQKILETKSIVPILCLVVDHVERYNVPVPEKYQKYLNTDE